MIQFIAKLIYYIIIFFMYKYFGIELTALYLLAALNTKLMILLYRD